MIAANVPLFIAILLAMIVAVWAVFHFRYAGLLESKDGQIALQDRQLADYRAKLEGATPDEAKARIDALEARLSAVEPRRLNEKQRSILVDALSGPASVTHVTLVTEMSGDSHTYMIDFERIFRSAKWGITNAQVLGTSDRPASGLAVRFSDLNNPPPGGRIILDAFKKAGIFFEVVKSPSGSPQTEIFITSPLKEV